MFSKTNIKNIKTEETSHYNGARKVLVQKKQTTSKYIEAITYGYLPSGEKWELHSHDNIVEVCIVTKGKGIIKDETGCSEEYEAGNRFIFPSGEKHEIQNTSDGVNEFYFFRFQDQ